MNRNIIIYTVLLFLHSGWASAELLKYIDESGKIWYVDRISVIPEKYRIQFDKKVDSENREKTTPVFSPRTEPPFLSTINAGSSQDSSGETIRDNKQLVEIFVTSGCPYCQKLINFLNSNNITFRKYDIENESYGKQLYAQIGGQGVPVTKIGSRVISGYDPDAISAALNGN